MGQALYRKHRPKNLGEVVGQEHITRTLEQALKTGRISHAYLFTGPRGTGKTSVARILAHEINQLPYTDSSMHMDIIEIDAASNRRIDEIRDLRDKVHIAPTSAKYKVYIIDEVHMLTREAFNALLKTLEEPPKHVIFILATTEVHKLPETIISRTQRYTFKPVDPTKVAMHLAEIAKAENISIDAAAVTHIAQAGEGSFRDSISLLDQASSLPGPIDDQAIRDLLGVVPTALLQDLLETLAHPTTSSHLLGAVTELYNLGYQAPQISHQLIAFLRQSLITDTLRLPLQQTLSVIEALLTIPNAHDPERWLEIVLLNHATTLQATTPKPLIKAATVPQIVRQQTTESPKVKPKPSPQQHSVTPTGPVIPLDDAAWLKVVDAVRAKYYTLYSVLKMGIPVFKDGELELGFDFAFHQKRVNDAKNKDIIATVIHDITGQQVAITCVKHVAGTKKKAGMEPLAPDHTSITDIFGGGELLKS